MFNLVQRITAREGISSGYKNNPRRKRRASNSPLEDNLKRMLSMILSQATGVPNGNHGLFHRYRVESLTLEAVRRSTHSSQANKNNIALLSLLKTIEGISRSLNNLLERFHQSYFFYILVANDRFVSIGDYMPCLIGMAAPLFIKAFLLWLKENDDEQQQNQSSTKSRPYKSVLMYISLVWFICFVAARLPVLQIFRQFATQNAIGTPLIISSIILASLVILSILALMVRFPEGGLELLHICALILMGTALMVIGLLNFSLGFLVAVVTTPLAIILTTSHLQKALKVLIIPYTIIINPLIAVGIVVSIYTLYQFPELELKQLALRSWAATKDTLAYTYIDSIVSFCFKFNNFTMIKTYFIYRFMAIGFLQYLFVYLCPFGAYF